MPDRLALYPGLGKVVAIGMWNVEKQLGALLLEGEGEQAQPWTEMADRSWRMRGSERFLQRGDAVAMLTLSVQQRKLAFLDSFLELDELLDQLAAADLKAAELVKLRFFTGLTGDETADVLGISPRSADLLWAYARAWLYRRLSTGE